MALSTQQETRGVCPQVGTRGWFSTKAFNYISTKVFPFNIDKISTPTIPVPPMTGTSGSVTYSMDQFQLHSVGAEAATVELRAGEGFQFTLSGLTAAMSVDYDIKNTGWPQFADAGTATIVVGKETSFSMFLRVGTNAAGNPTLTAENVQINFKLADMQFQNNLINLVKGVVMFAVESQVKSLAAQGINTFLNGEDLNNLIEGVDFGIPLSGTTPTPWSVAMKVCSVQVTDDYIVSDLYAAVEGADVYPTAPVSLSETPSSIMASSMFGGAAAEWFTNGAFWFLAESNLLEAGIPNPSVPQSASADGLSFSGYTALELDIIDPPTINFNEGGFSATAGTRMSLVTDSESSGDEVSVDVPISAKATYVDGKGSVALSADGDASDLVVGAGASKAFQGKDAAFYSSLFIQTANENVESLMDQLMAANKDGSKGLQLVNQQLEFSDQDVTAYGDISVDVEKLIEAIMTSDLGAKLLGR